MTKNQFFVHYHASEDGYDRGKTVKYYYKILIKPSQRTGFKDVEIQCMKAEVDGGGLNQMIGFEGDVEAALNAAKNQIDQHHPELFGTLVASGIDSD